MFKVQKIILGLITLVFFSGFSAPQLKAKESLAPIPKINIYTRTDFDHSGAPNGPTVEKVKTFMDQTGLEYSIIMVPWNRAYTLSKTKNNSLIFDLDRIQERENQFHWILETEKTSFNLITRNTKKMKRLTQKKIIKGDFTAACARNASSCTLFLKFGIPENRIIKVPTLGDGEQLSLLYRNRADFIIGNFERMKVAVKKLDFLEGKIVTILDDFQISTYLAAGKNVDTRVLRILQTTAEKFKNSPY